MWVGGKCPAPAALPQVERAGTQFTGGWMGPRAELDGCGKYRPAPESDPIIHQIMSRNERFRTWSSAVSTPDDP